MLWQLASGARHAAPLHARALAFAPQGGRLALADERGCHVLSDRLETVADFPGPLVQTLAWGQDGTSVAGLAGNEVWLWDLAARRGRVVQFSPGTFAPVQVVPSEAGFLLSDGENVRLLRDDLPQGSAGLLRWLAGATRVQAPMR